MPARVLRGEEVTDVPDLARAKLAGELIPVPPYYLRGLRSGYKGACPTIVPVVPTDLRADKSTRDTGYKILESSDPRTPYMSMGARVGVRQIDVRIARDKSLWRVWAPRRHHPNGNMESTFHLVRQIWAKPTRHRTG